MKVFLTAPNTFGIRIISSYISIIVELQIVMSNYIRFLDFILEGRKTWTSKK